MEREHWKLKIYAVHVPILEREQRVFSALTVNILE